MNKVQKRILEINSDMVTQEEYLLMKFYQRDWHAVQDAASDLRDMQSELKGLEHANSNILSK